MPPQITRGGLRKMNVAFIFITSDATIYHKGQRPLLRMHKKKLLCLRCLHCEADKPEVEYTVDGFGKGS
jgi:hypothetical protein